jgi:hypothetical protein
MTSEESEEKKPVFRTIFGAEVLWPMDCPDDILESVIKEIKRLENDEKLVLDKDGLQVHEI